jgi:hypothetical protein
VKASTVAAVVVFAAGLFVAAGALGSSIVTVVLPRGVRSRLGRAVFLVMRVLFKVRVRSSSSYETRDRVLALYGPLSLLVLLATWVIGILIGYTGMFWAVGVRPLRHAVTISGGSITTLGLITPKSMPQIVLAITEALLGVGEVALLITFLPSIYGDYHRRERDVAKLRTEAGLPPEGVKILIRLFQLERLDARTEIWARWIDWFVDVEDSHSASPVLAVFRSPVPEYSWVTAAGAVLDGASLAASCLDAPRDYEAELCIRTGYLCLRRIASLFALPFDPDPSPTDPISVLRVEFDEAYQRMASAGLPLRDQDQSWRDFAGWRVNYDEPLIRLATLAEAPIAPWSSDRGLVDGRHLTLLERIRR